MKVFCQTNDVGIIGIHALYNNSNTHTIEVWTSNNKI